MYRFKKTLRTTQPRVKPQDIHEAHEYVYSTPETKAACEMFCFAALANNDEDTLYTDLAGSFPVWFFSENQYMFIAYMYEPRAILVRSMKSREIASMLRAFKDIYNYLRARNFIPKLHVIDN